MSPNSVHHHQAFVATLATKSGTTSTPRAASSRSASGSSATLAASTITRAPIRLGLLAPDHVGERGGDEQLGVEREPVGARALLLAGAARSGRSRRARRGRASSRSTSSPSGFGDQALAVGDPDHADARRARGSARSRRPSSRSPGSPRAWRRAPGPTRAQRGERRLGDAVAADHLAERDPVDVDRERRAQPGEPGGRVVEPQQRGLDRGAQAGLGERRRRSSPAGGRSPRRSPSGARGTAASPRRSGAARPPASGSYGSQSIPPFAPPNGR